MQSGDEAHALYCRDGEQVLLISRGKFRERLVIEDLPDGPTIAARSVFRRWKERFDRAESPKTPEKYE